MRTRTASMHGRESLTLLSVTGYSSALVLGWQSSLLPTDHVAWPSSCRARGARPCPRHEQVALRRNLSNQMIAP